MVFRGLKDGIGLICNRFGSQHLDDRSLTFKEFMRGRFRDWRSDLGVVTKSLCRNKRFYNQNLILFIKSSCMFIYNKTHV